MSENYFVELNNINVSDKIEKKGNLSYLSWTYAWGELKKRHPDATYAIYEDNNGMFYHTDGKTCWVKTGVTVDGNECIEYLPVMDNKNKSIPLEAVTSFEVNTAIQRSLTKAVARHGLGLYVYAGEDLPEAEKDPPPVCDDCGSKIVTINKRNGEPWPANNQVEYSKQRYKKTLCPSCMKKEEKLMNEREKAAALKQLEEAKVNA